jgi:hypothetical protein
MPIASEPTAAQCVLGSRNFPGRIRPSEMSGGGVLKTEERAFVRVGEAATILGISKSAGYELAISRLATEGRAGLPAVRMGRCIQ